MKRTPLVLAASAVAAVAVVAGTMAASANVGGGCTTTGVNVTLSGFKGYHEVPWDVKSTNGDVLASGRAKFTGQTTFPVVLDVVPNTPVVISAKWGPVVGRDTGSAPSTAKCITVPDTPPVTTPPTTPEPPVTTPTTPTTPITTPRPPRVPPRRDCAWLRGKGAGVKTLKKFGCYRTPARCLPGERRVVSRHGGVVTAICIKRVTPSVTG